MTQPELDMELLAKSILACELGDRKSAADVADATSQAVDKLRRRLRRLFGDAGFQALLARGLTLAKGDHPVLEHVVVDPAGGLRGFAEAAAGCDEAEVSRGAAAVLA